MLRTLLEERFALRTHVETRDIPIYALTRVRPDRLGPDLRPSDVDCATVDRRTEPTGSKLSAFCSRGQVHDSVGSIDGGGMRRVYRRHRQDLAFDELHPLVVGENPELSQALILVGREPSPAACARDVVDHHGVKHTVVCKFMCAVRNHRATVAFTAHLAHPILVRDPRDAA